MLVEALCLLGLLRGDGGVELPGAGQVFQHRCGSARVLEDGLDDAGLGAAVFELVERAGDFEQRFVGFQFAQLVGLDADG